MPNKTGKDREPAALRKEAASVSVAVRMPAALRTKAQRAANLDGRTLNNWILQLIRKELA